MKKYVIAIFGILCLGIMIQQLLAQQENTTTGKSAGPAAAQTASDAHEAVCDGCVTLDFENADIRNVLEILSYKAKINIVPSPDVQGLVTIKLKNVTWQDALNVILKTYGYGYDQRGNIIVVTTVQNLKKLREDDLILADQESVMTKTFILDYADATQVVGSIEKMLTARGTVNFDKRTNVLIVRDTPSNLEVVAKVVERLDAATPQVLIEAKIIETTLTNTENMGIDWTFKAGASGSARPAYWPFTENSSNKFLSGPGMNFPTPDTNLFTFGVLDFSQMQAVLELLKS
ncbi:MAG TPA: secretin N-terminal domain-containing protein, partial [Candidatus Omnitrophota bacterium]|nr:secretin N-terminal domain-containing protein [Candidatus Omnitrophota bacterium]